MLKEETTKYVKKIVDPALMTWGEFSNAINSAGKSHPETAYKTTYEINKGKEYKSKKNYPTLINRFVSNNMEFELRENIEKGLLGYVHLIYIETRDAYRVFHFLQNPPKMGMVLNELLASRLFDEKTPLIVDDSKGMFEKYINKDLYEIKDGLAYSKTRYMDYKSLGRMEKKERLKICDNDRFKAEEAEVLIMELADSLAED